MSTKLQFIKQLALLLIAAITLYVTIIMPAEYNQDPTGIGKWLGLTSISQQPLTTVTDAQDRVSITLEAGQGIEYKLAMNKGQQVEYEWYTNHSSLFTDLHGEPQGDTTGYFLSYLVTTSEQAKGMFIAPFNGSHGWYWKNNSELPITVTLTLTGDYSVEGIKQ